MRAGGGCSMQQSLTPEAGNIVKQAINLARRRGHAQVTPIHVASVMLVSPAGLLRTACLKSHSHPLQCKALELCFNVALNRLPTTTPTPITSASSSPSGHHHHYYSHRNQYPSLSNALVAAFKRAQAHQRRGSIENQQQPILALKIETEQLVISILDDPSVSRVMREAGFSSPQIKSNVEQSVSLEVTGTHDPPPPRPLISTSHYPRDIDHRNNSIIGRPLFITSSSHTTCNAAAAPFEVTASTIPNNSKTTSSYSQVVDVKEEDVSSVVDSLTSKRRKNTVIVGECLASCDGVVRAVKERIERGNVPLELRQHVQFLTLPMHSVKNMSREEVDFKLGELKSCVLGGRGILLYLGDLKWLSEYWGHYKNHGTAAGDQQQQQRRNYYYCPLEHMIMGLRRLVFGCNYNNNNNNNNNNNAGSARLWLMGIATFSSYIMCKAGHNPSLETLLDLHPLTIPVGGLELSLNLFDRSGSHEVDTKSNILSDGETEKCGGWSFMMDSKFDMHELTCCTDCSANFHREARSLSNSSTPTTSTTSSSLPSWLQKCIKEEIKDDSTIDQGDSVQIKELCKKWNSFCSSTHNTTTTYFGGGKAINFSTSSSPSSSTSVSSYDQQTKKLTWPNISFDPKWPSHKDQHFPLTSTDQKPDLLSNPNSTPNSASSSEATEPIITEKPPSFAGETLFKEHNVENLKAMCLALEKRVPWQKEIIPDIASTVLKCRAGLMLDHNNRTRKAGAKKQETWLFFLGVDDEGKIKIAEELSKLVFGSDQSNFKSISLMSSNFASTCRADSTDHEFRNNKRGRDEAADCGGGCSYLERFAEAVRDNPHRVFYVEDVEQIDQISQKGIKRAIETGEIVLPDGGVVPFKDGIVIFSCESLSSTSRACSPPTKQKVDEEKELKVQMMGSEDDEDEEASTGACLPLDLNILAAHHDDQNGSGENTISRILKAVDRQIFFKIQVL